MRVTRRHICCRHLPLSHAAKRNTRKAQKRAQPKLLDVKHFALVGDNTNYYQSCCSYYFRALGELCGGTVTRLVELDIGAELMPSDDSGRGDLNRCHYEFLQASMTAICCLILLKAGSLWRREVRVGGPSMQCILLSRRRWGGGPAMGGAVRSWTLICRSYSLVYVTKIKQCLIPWNLRL